MNIAEDALDVIRNYAEERSLSLGQAAPDLALRGAAILPRFQRKNGWVVFDVPPGTPPVTTEAVAQLENAEYEEEARRALSPGR